MPPLAYPAWSHSQSHSHSHSHPSKSVKRLQNTLPPTPSLLKKQNIVSRTTPTTTMTMYSADIPSSSSSSSQMRSSLPSSSAMSPPVVGSSSSAESLTLPSIALSSSRASSMTGRKRPRESDAAISSGTDSKPGRAARRTKSVSDTQSSSIGDETFSLISDSHARVRDREAFQRGLIAVFVPRALQAASNGNLTHYSELLARFQPSPTQPNVALSPLLPLIRALTANVSLLNHDVHGSLVSAVVSLPWATGDDRFVKSYVGWAGVLVSAHPTWAKEVVGMAVKGLAWQRKIQCTLPITRRVFHARHHLLLSHLLSLVPTLPNVLQPLLTRHFPHKREPEVAQSTWVRNCCDLIDYCPELGPRVWSSIVDRMLRIDVEITNRAEDDDEEEDEEEDEEVDDNGAIPAAQFDPFDLLVSEEMPRDEPFPAEAEEDDDDGEIDFDDLSSADSGDEDEDEPSLTKEKQAELKAKKRAALQEMRKRLDGMLSHFLRHLEETMGTRDHGISAPEIAARTLSTTPNSSGRSTPTADHPPSSLPSLHLRQTSNTPAQSLAHFQNLLNVFTRQILPTSATQHIPFLLFLCSSFSPAHTELFLGLLVSQALYATTTIQPSAATPPVALSQRVAATVYIGSLVCRARFVSDDQARTVLTYLLAYIDGKLHQARQNAASIRNRSSSNGSAPVDELPLFYAVCQAVMLIFCFRWRAFGIPSTTDMDGEEDGDEDTGIVGELDLDSGSDSGMDDARNRGVARSSSGRSGKKGGGSGKWMRDLDILQRAITSELNPLLGCNPVVVNSFAKVAHKTNFAYCFSIIEANNQMSHPRSSSSHSLAAALGNGSTSTSSGPTSTSTPTNSGLPPRGSIARTSSTGSNYSLNPSLSVPRQARQVNIDANLDNYFPFDPYDLPLSGRFVNPLYRTWGDVAVDLDEDEDDDEDEEDEEVEDDEDEDDVLDLDAGESETGESALSTSKGLSTSRSFPKQSKIGSFGDARKRLLRDGGLSSSLENMSISPNVIGGR